MKQYTLLTFLLLISGFLMAQSTTEVINIPSKDLDNFLAQSNYKFPTFTRAHVQLKNGEQATGRFNYNYFLDNLVYINEKNDTVALANTDDVDYVSFPVDSFFYDKKFYQWVASSGTATLAVRYTYRLARKDNVGAYGSTSPTQNVESHTSILGMSKYDLDGASQLSFEKTTTYYIRKTNGKFVSATLHNFERIFPKKDLSDYVQNNKLNLKKQADMVDLFVYANR